jgi:hypothetical protein
MYIFLERRVMTGISNIRLIKMAMKAFDRLDLKTKWAIKKVVIPAITAKP